VGCQEKYINVASKSMVQKIFYTGTGAIDITCPKCGKIRQRDISKYLKMDKALNFKATCKCKHVFPVTIERRQHIRKQVNLKGVLIQRSQQYPVKISDISKFGMRLMTDRHPNIMEGERLVVKFVLDDQLRSEVSKDIVVRKKTGTYVGCEFLSDDHYDAFGKYLLFYFQ
jgi:hypothetical protein